MSKKTKPCELLWETKLNVTHQKKATPKLAWLLGWLHSCTHQHYMVYKSDFLPKKVFFGHFMHPPPPVGGVLATSSTIKTSQKPFATITSSHAAPRREIQLPGRYAWNGRSVWEHLTPCEGLGAGHRQRDAVVDDVGQNAGKSVVVQV